MEPGFVSSSGQHRECATVKCALVGKLFSVQGCSVQGQRAREALENGLVSRVLLEEILRLIIIVRDAYIAGARDDFTLVSCGNSTVQAEKVIRRRI